MKHKHYLILLFILMSMAVCSTALVSCGDDDEPLPTEQKTSQDDEEKKDEEKEESKQPEEDPEKSTTDVAVTGRVSEVGAFYARIGGVVNLDVISASYTKVEIGVEISTQKDFAQKMRIKATEVVGRKFSILASHIASETMFYYRTYVSVSTLSYDYYGETYSFWTLKTVDDIAVTGQTEDIGIAHAKIAGKVNLSDLKPIDGSATVGIEMSKDENFSSGYQYDSATRYGGTTSSINCYFRSLFPGTKYYYRTYVSVSSFPSSCRYYGEIKSFTTKALSVPLATTGQAEVEFTSAQISGKADLSEITGLKSSVGIEVSEASDLSNPKRLTTTDTSKEFTCRFTGLNPSSKYYYRTFVKVDFGSEEKEYYGATKTFTTKGYDSDYYVDLGLPSGTLWATCNVGASNPGDYGGFFAWGETTTKSTYDWSNYKYSKFSNDYKYVLTKYCNVSGFGYNDFYDHLKELLPEDDAATANWGADWRMPTIEQFIELFNSRYTTTTWTTRNGNYGRLITSKMSGYTDRSIFLPAAGYRGVSLHYLWNSNGFYWSRTLYDSYPNGAHYLSFSSSGIGIEDFSSRCHGLSVRPVRVSQ